MIIRVVGPQDTCWDNCLPIIDYQQSFVPQFKCNEIVSKFKLLKSNQCSYNVWFSDRFINSDSTLHYDGFIYYVVLWFSKIKSLVFSSDSHLFHHQINDLTGGKKLTRKCFTSPFPSLSLSPLNITKRRRISFKYHESTWYL